MLLRVPGLGVRNVKRILATRRQRTIRFADLAKLRCDIAKARHFVVAGDWIPRTLDVANLRAKASPHQLALM
jgi:predicted DNA-binding helix-hairpin-helix protein